MSTDNTIWLKNGRNLRQVDGSVQLIKDLNRVGKKEKNNDDKEYIVREYHIGVNSRKANTSVNVAFMQTDEMFGSFGTITKPINEDGILVTEDDYGYKYFIKVLNVEDKPSLYRGELCY